MNPYYNQGYEQNIPSATILPETEIIALSKSLYTILKVENLFKKTDFRERYGQQLLRIGAQFNNINRKKEITNNYLDEYLKWNTEKVPDPPMTRFDCLVELTTILCSFALTHYEFLKRFFIESLDLILLFSKTNMKYYPRPTYGSLVKSFENLPNFDKKMNDMLDEDFRNALAHDTWYFDKDGLRYNNLKQEIITIPFGEIPKKINTIVIIYSVITNNYYQDFFPGIEQQYQKERKEINKLFPLYGMNED